MIYRDHFQNYKRYSIPKAQLIIADIPYNLGNNAYASNPAWYKDGDNTNGESELAGKSFFDTDEDFRPAEFMHFCSTMLKAETKPKKVDGEARQKGDAPCMIIFCAFDQQMYLIELAKRYGLNNYINLVFRQRYRRRLQNHLARSPREAQFLLSFLPRRLVSSFVRCWHCGCTWFGLPKVR